MYRKIYSHANSIRVMMMMMNREKIYLVFLFMSAAWQTILKIVC